MDKGDVEMRFMIIAFVTVFWNLSAHGQDMQQQRQERHGRYKENAEVHHVANTASISANSPRPLAQALTALSEEYAWAIDFEDPPYYSKYDLVDDTAPEWRAAHPNAKGVTVIAGDGFQTQLPENANADTSPAAEEHILDRVVSDYNASGNPGRFNVLNEGDGRFAVVGGFVKDENGTDQGITPILDTPITVQMATRDALTAIHVILNALSAKTQTKVMAGMLALNPLHQAQVTVGGENIPARVFLLQTLASAKIKLYWHLYYDNDAKMYALNVLPLMKANYDASGNRKTDFVR
jgi:hypothetical protein